MRSRFTAFLCIVLSRHCLCSDQVSSSRVGDPDASKRQKLSDQIDPSLVDLASRLLMLDETHASPTAPIEGSVSHVQEGSALNPQRKKRRGKRDHLGEARETSVDVESRSTETNIDGVRGDISGVNSSSSSELSKVSAPLLEIDLNFMGFGYGPQTEKTEIRRTNSRAEMEISGDQACAAGNDVCQFSRRSRLEVLPQRVAAAGFKNQSAELLMSQVRLCSSESILDRSVRNAACSLSANEVDAVAHSLDAAAHSLATAAASVDTAAHSDVFLLSSVRSFETMARNIPTVDYEEFSSERLGEFLSTNREKFGPAVRVGTFVIFPELFAKFLLMQKHEAVDDDMSGGALDLLSEETDLVSASTHSPVTSLSYFPVIRIYDERLLAIGLTDTTKLGSTTIPGSASTKPCTSSSMFCTSSSKPCTSSSMPCTSSPVVYRLNKVPMAWMKTYRGTMSTMVPTTKLKMLGTLKRLCSDIYNKGLASIQGMSIRAVKGDTLESRMDEVFSSYPIEAWRYVRPDKCIVGLMRLVDQFEARAKVFAANWPASQTGPNNKDANAKLYGLVVSLYENQRRLLLLMGLVNFVEVYDFKRKGKSMVVSESGTETEILGGVPNDSVPNDSVPSSSVPSSSVHSSSVPIDSDPSDSGPSSSGPSSSGPSRTPLVDSLRARVVSAFGEFKRATAVRRESVALQGPPVRKDPIENTTNSALEKEPIENKPVPPVQKANPPMYKGQMGHTSQVSESSRPLPVDNPLPLLDVDFEFDHLGCPRNTVLTEHGKESVLSPFFFLDNESEGDGIQPRAAGLNAVSGQALKESPAVSDTSNVLNRLPAGAPLWASALPVLYLRLSQVLNLLQLLRSVVYENELSLLSTLPSSESSPISQSNALAVVMSMEDAYMHFSANRVGNVFRINEYIVAYSSLEVLLLTGSRRLLSDVEFYRVVPAPAKSKTELIDLTGEDETQDSEPHSGETHGSLQLQGQQDQCRVSGLSSGKCTGSSTGLVGDELIKSGSVEVIRVPATLFRMTLLSSHLWRSLALGVGQVANGVGQVAIGLGPTTDIVDEGTRVRAESLKELFSRLDDLTVPEFAKWFGVKKLLFVYLAQEVPLRLKIRQSFVYTHRTLEPKTHLATCLVRTVELRALLAKYLASLSGDDVHVEELLKLSEISLNLKGLKLAHIVLSELMFGGVSRNDVLGSEISALAVEVDRLEKEIEEKRRPVPRFEDSDKGEHRRVRFNVEGAEWQTSTEP